MTVIDLSLARTAFRIGQRLNEIRWNAEIACLFGDAHTQELLGGLRIEVAPLLTREDRQSIDAAIEAASHRLPSVLHSEQFAEHVNDAEESLRNPNDPRSTQEIREEAYAIVFSSIRFLCTDLLQQIQAAVEASATGWLVLGRRMDEGIRSSVAEAMAQLAPAGYLAGTPPQSGSLPVPAGWRQTVWAAWQAVLPTIGIPTFGATLTQERWMTGAPADLVTAVEAEFERFAPPAPAAGTALVPNEQKLLTALHALGAFDEQHLQPLKVIVYHAFGSNASPTSYKKYIGSLKDHQMVNSTQGQTGGYWLTAQGKAAAEALAAG